MNTCDRIFVLYSDTERLRRIEALLESRGFEVAATTPAPDSVDAAVSFHPVVILMDVGEFGSGELEHYVSLRRQPSLQSVPIILITEGDAGGLIEHALSAGANDFLSCPFSDSQLLVRVEAQIRFHDTLRELLSKSEQNAALAKRLAEANTALLRLSRFDPLTELLNRRAWQELVDMEVARSKRTALPYGILMIDVDHFKPLNDLLGHHAGDDCLRRIAHAIRDACREVDIVGRYGGEEFIVMATETDHVGLHVLAERVRKAVWNLGIVHPGESPTHCVTVSVGCAVSESNSVNRVIASADRALYTAKRQGRNRVAHAYSNSVTFNGSSELHHPPSEGGNPEGDLILIGDAEEERLNRYERWLINDGLKVARATTGKNVISLSAAKQPSLIVMDVSIQQFDYKRTIHGLRSHAEYGEAPIILLGSPSIDEELRECLNLGIDEYTHRSLDRSEFLLRVRSMLRFRRERQELLRSYALRGEQARVFSSLLEFSRKLTYRNNLDQIVEQTLHVAAALTTCRRVAIMMPDESESKLEVVNAVGPGSEDAVGHRVTINETPIGAVFRTRKHCQFAMDTGDGETLVSVPAWLGTLPVVAVPMETSEEVVGVMCLSDRSETGDVSEREMECIELIAQISASAIHDLLTLQAHEQACDSIVVALAKLAEYRDNDTGRHVERVKSYCRILAEQLSTIPSYSTIIDDEFLHDLERAVPLHDIGKVAVPDSILLKPGRLDADEVAIMQRHAETGADTIRAVRANVPQARFLKMAEDIAHSHHEWFNGGGYPRGLEGDAIPLAARIVALADVYDALTSKRVYKRAMSHEQAREILLEGRGSQFDPTVVDAFVSREVEFCEASQRLADDESDLLCGVQPNVSMPGTLGPRDRHGADSVIARVERPSKAPQALMQE